MADEPCSEPGGNEVVTLFDGFDLYAHDIMLAENGQCPWCGMEE